MINERAFERFRQTNLAVGYELRDNFRVVINFKIAAEVRVIFLNGVEAVRADRNDLFHAVAVHHIDVGLRQRLEQILIAGTHRGIAAAAFFRSQNTEADTGFLENLGKRDGNLLASIVKRAGAADVEEIFHIGIFSQRFHTEFLGPVSADMRAHAPRIGVVFHVAAAKLQFR